ncbi:Bifunctional inhibitor/lipid-transfer protein/seed storage 2S albumin superfamily protein [Rhynchospora pubera]|uniref:Bifunctional inhibitor/lipid-transfer protein/seed storage 2S albumin superfamily protein n=1 Tax=Rhynchospora pubera TaxID=906938 RepID=A0AAV8ENT6_9POAL|nr:Bifunctional inhibitor/lipid-transfer protein/seed storage 2S albumin superfamily protein [Rhynchospora pubera]KAJ4783050.1 Bifunctional inhibitor/lipid-transfer protein/seed storage 2S albumin superfamily protein [Rhynchospora pubera]
MAPTKHSCLSTVLTFLAVFCTLSSAQVPLPPLGQQPPATNPTPPVQVPPVQTCNPSSAVTSLAPCLGYLMGSSSSPSTACCSLISSLLSSQSPCLCSMLQGGLNPLGFVFNQTQAISLPSICNMPSNPCTDASSPTSEPSTPATPSIPAAASPSTDEPTPTVTAQSPAAAATPPVSSKPSGAGVKAVPTTVSAAVGSPTNLAPSLLIVAFVASYLWTKGF